MSAIMRSGNAYNQNFVSHQGEFNLSQGQVLMAGAMAIPTPGGPEKPKCSPFTASHYRRLFDEAEGKTRDALVHLVEVCAKAKLGLVGDVSIKTAQQSLIDSQKAYKKAAEDYDKHCPGGDAVLVEERLRQFSRFAGQVADAAVNNAPADFIITLMAAMAQVVGPLLNPLNSNP